MKYRKIIQTLLSECRSSVFSTTSSSRANNWFSGVIGKALMIALGIMTSAAVANERRPAPSPVASWNFNQGESPLQSKGTVSWRRSKNGLVPVNDTELQGLEFFYRGNGPEGDSTSELRYSIKKPLSHTWEYLKIYQPDNFYHRAIIKVQSPRELNIGEWREGDIVENNRGVRATVYSINGDKLYITDYEERFAKNWGKGRIISNLTTGVELESLKSTEMASNNKFSTQWQGKYSNAGMTLETQSLTPKFGGKFGVGYCRPTVNKSKSHPATGTVANADFNNKPAVCFDPEDNGREVEFVIERKRSSSNTARNGGYRIWKKVEDSDWNLIFSNLRIRVFQKKQNYFDNGYVFGWANSGYKEDTRFYLLNWQLWSVKPPFLP